MKFKTSNYNFFADPENGERLAFNAMTGALAKFNDEDYEEYMQIEQGLENQSELDPELRHKIHEGLLDGGFIYAEDGAGDSELIEYSFNRSKFDDRVLKLTIAPTMTCNYECPYCFENKMGVKKTSMSAKTIEDVANFVERRLKYKIGLDITWYGGEPLLAFDTIKTLSEKFMESTRKHNCEYTSKIITNGYYLTKDVVDELRKYNLKSAQITIDGPREIHDARRYDKKSGKSFDRIIENIDYAREFIAILIHMNVDKENAPHVDTFINYLIDTKLSDKNISFQMGPVGDCNNTFDAKQLSQLLSANEYYKMENEIVSRAILERKITWMGSYPSPKSIICGAVNIGNFGIDSEGYVFKCWEDMGDQKEALYHVANPGRTTKTELRWMNWSPMNDEDCKPCKFLPICQGGCPLHALRGSKTCSYWKDHLDEMLSVLAYKYEHLVKPNQ